MRFYNRRLAKIARRRRETNMLGRSNRGRRCLIPGFTLRSSDIQGLVGALFTWAGLELVEAWRGWRAPRIPVATPAVATE